MHNRRGFLSNIVGIGTVPFIGKVAIATEQEIDQFGKPDIVLGKRQNSQYKTSLTLTAFCGMCDWNLTKIIQEINNGEKKYHIIYHENYNKQRNDIVLQQVKKYQQ